MLFILVPLLLLLSGCAGSGTGSSNERFTKFSDNDVRKNVIELQTAGLLKKIEQNSYYVDLDVWVQLNIDAKKGACMTFADYASIGGLQDRCEVYDYMSGKRLAELGAGGFDTF